MDLSPELLALDRTHQPDDGFFGKTRRSDACAANDSVLATDRVSRWHRVGVAGQPQVDSLKPFEPR